MIIPLNDREAEIANLRYIEGWNAAIEEAASRIENHWETSRTNVVEMIRGLNK